MNSCAPVAQKMICPCCEVDQLFICIHSEPAGWRDTCVECGSQWVNGEPDDDAGKGRENISAAITQYISHQHGRRDDEAWLFLQYYISANEITVNGEPLAASHLDVLKFIRAFIKKNNYSPTPLELCDEFRVTMPTMIDVLQFLEHAELITIFPYRERGIRLKGAGQVEFRGG